MTKFNMQKHLLVGVLLLVLASITEVHALQVASYNIRYANKEDIKNGNGWEQRCPVILKLITSHDFDVMGMQEVLHGQLNDLRKGLPDYAYVGVGRDDGKEKGEYSPILYKKKRFLLMDSGVFWLSETSGRPSKGWDAAFPRICTWAKLQDSQTAQIFWFFNTHMDHKGAVAKKESARLILQRIGKMCGGDPVILTGDFNADQKSEGYNLIKDSGTLMDAYDTAKVRSSQEGTVNHFNLKPTTDRIDHIFATSSWKVERYGILTDSYRSEEGGKASGGTESVTRFPSDHFPVVVELQRQ